MPTVIADWDDVRDRAEAHRPDSGSRLPSRRVVAIAAMIVLTGLLVAPALAIGDHILELIYGKSTPGDVQTPAWSPDGRKLAFVSQRDGNAEIYVMNADGSAQENLTRQPANDSHPSWSRDGAEARVRQPTRRQLRDLRHERRRERAAQRDADSVGRSRSGLVA